MLKEELSSHSPLPAALAWLARACLLLALPLSLGACAVQRLDVVESSSTTLSREADGYERQARNLQMAGAGRAGAELQRLGDQRRLDAKRAEPKGIVEGLVDLLFNSMLQSWANSAANGVQYKK